MVFSEAVEQAGRAAEAQASKTMSQVGHTLDQVARAIRDAGDGIRTDQPQVAGIADTAAGKVEEVSRYLTEHDAREVLDNAQGIARREPIVVVGAGLLAGLALGRLLKSASGNGGARGYGAGGYGSYAGGNGGTDYYGGGYAGAGRRGARAVLEVRSREVPFILEHGQIVGRLVYEKMMARPDTLYGQGIGSNYQAQGLKLSKHFKS